ncbi:MAG TPA: hypothetical protein VN414_13175, partial [Methanosarcina sp.]|nr:hypothetical protein [Methanosarcina sp.]
MKMHQKAFDLFQSWYNFIKPHKSLRLKSGLWKKKMVPKNSSNGRRNSRSHMESKGIINL